MQLLTKELQKQLPAIGTTSGNPEAKAVVKFFYPAGRWTWYAFEASAFTDDGEELPLADVELTAVADVQFYGYVKGADPQDDELGFFSLRELVAFRGFGGLGIERDIAFTPVTLDEIKKQAHA